MQTHQSPASQKRGGLFARAFSRAIDKNAGTTQSRKSLLRQLSDAANNADENVVLESLELFAEQPAISPKISARIRRLLQKTAE